MVNEGAGGPRSRRGSHKVVPSSDQDGTGVERATGEVPCPSKDFYLLAVTCPFDDETLKSLFWIGANYHRPIDLPDSMALSWIIQCLESIRPLSKTQHEPEPSQPLPPSCTEGLPEPTADGEPEAARGEATAPAIAPEPEAVDAADQVCEPATPHVPEGILVEYEGMDRSPAHAPTTEGEPPLASGNVVDYFLDCPESLPLPPPLHISASSFALSSLVPVNLSAHPQSAPSWSLFSLWVFQSPAPPWREDPLSPPLVSKAWIPPRPFDPSALPWLLAPSSPPWPVIPLAPSSLQLVRCQSSSPEDFPPPAALRHLKTDLMRQFDTQVNEFMDSLIEESASLVSSHVSTVFPLSDKEKSKLRHTRPPQGQSKQFVIRRSLLDDLFEVNHIRTIYHMFIALLILFIFSTLVVDFIDEGRLEHSQFINTFGIRFALVFKKKATFFFFSVSFQVLGCLFYAYYIFVRLCIPQFRSISMQLFDLRAMVLCVFNSILPGVLVLFLAFFAFLHCWLNAFAEMLRFGDRMFYKDWWNSTSFANYYRTWNVVVHDWLYYYVYRDFLWMTQKRFRAAAMLVVFTVSAVVHEYVLAICFGFFYPVLFCIFMCFGMVFNFILNDRRKGPIWNVIMWTALFLGQGVLICLYSQEWYAQRFCPIQEPSFIDLLKPRSWTCSP
ncbi:sterol O-acyltransferase 1-like [Sinocyclocheilus grahami]|uniref:sterol O-acyltransferase 1-like n=1 Tax=Sinocyclocheilus grahami TaxID=75366 RepID=UPI0007ACED38|nr:PREDICTED: sterol O-acyltransferase 1-like [Sinocyclocheilus grahami]